jgi:hypothetical protein
MESRGKCAESRKRLKAFRSNKKNSLNVNASERKLYISRQYSLVNFETLTPICLLEFFCQVPGVEPFGYQKELIDLFQKRWTKV